MTQRKDGQGRTSAFKRPGCPVAGQQASGRVCQPRGVWGAPRRSEESLSGNAQTRKTPLSARTRHGKHTAAPRSHTAKTITLI